MKLTSLVHDLPLDFSLLKIERSQKNVCVKAIGLGIGREKARRGGGGEGGATKGQCEYALDTISTHYASAKGNYRETWKRGGGGGGGGKCKLLLPISMYT